MTLIACMVVGATAAAWYFPVLFFIRSDWNSNIAGKSQMWFSLIIAAVLTLSSIRLFGVILPEWFRMAVYGAIVAGLISQDITLTKVQNRRSSRIARENRERESIRELP
jgi:hypothetical protein